MSRVKAVCWAFDPSGALDPADSSIAMQRVRPGRSSLWSAIHLRQPVNLWFWWSRQGEFLSGKTTGTWGQASLLRPCFLLHMECGCVPSPQSIWTISSHRPIGKFPLRNLTTHISGKKPPPKELNLLGIYIFLEKKHKMCLISEHVFLSFQL